MKCLNRKVLGGLGLTALAVWALAPGVVGAALPLLFLAACPLSMVGMTWAVGHGPGSSSAVGQRNPRLPAGGPRGGE